MSESTTKEHLGTEDCITEDIGELPQDTVKKSTTSFRKHLHACINTGGGHFELQCRPMRCLSAYLSSSLLHPRIAYCLLHCSQSSFSSRSDHIVCYLSNKPNWIAAKGAECWHHCWYRISEFFILS